MKIYIVLGFIRERDHREFCRVDRLYTSRKQATKRKKSLEKRVNFDDVSYHVIEKTLKGRL